VPSPTVGICPPSLSVMCAWLTLAAGFPTLAARVASVPSSVPALSVTAGMKTPGEAVMTWLALSALISKASASRNR